MPVATSWKRARDNFSDRLPAVKARGAWVCVLRGPWWMGIEVYPYSKFEPIPGMSRSASLRRYGTRAR